MTEGSSNLFLSSSLPLITCKIHPVVIFTILDHYVRRSESQERVIGTLLGVETDGVVEIRNCFPVPHSEESQVAVDMDFQKSMFDLHFKANPNEMIVGWYATGKEINQNSLLIHDFYWKEVQRPPIHLTVDTELTDGRMDIQTYTSKYLGFSESVGQVFLPIPHSIDTNDFETSTMSTLLKTKNSPNLINSLDTDLSSLELSLENLLEMLDTISNYIDKVIKGEISSDNKIGRFLANTISSLPRIEPSMFEKMFSNSLQDLLMVVYLANLTRTQLILAEKLQNSL